MFMLISFLVSHLFDKSSGESPQAPSTLILWHTAVTRWHHTQLTVCFLVLHYFISQPLKLNDEILHFYLILNRNHVLALLLNYFANNLADPVPLGTVDWNVWPNCQTQTVIVVVVVVIIIVKCFFKPSACCFFQDSRLVGARKKDLRNRVKDLASEQRRHSPLPSLPF